MKILCAFSKYQYGRPDLGVGIEYAALLKSLQRLGHEVVHFETWERSRYPDFITLNRALLDAVERDRPDVLFAVQALYEIWTETLDIIGHRGDVATVNWTTDDSWKYIQFSRFLVRHYHAFTTTYPTALQRYRREGHQNVMLTQWAASAEALQPPLPAADCEYPVSFVGAAHGNRRKSMTRLRELGVDVMCFGQGWPKGPVPVEEIPRIMRRSVISLNFANSAGENQIKARTFEVPGAGGFLLTEDAPGLARWYTPGAEVATYRSLAELAHKVRHYLAHPRERDRIATAGYRRTALEHTYDARLRVILDFTLAQHARFKQGRLAHSAPSFETAAERHRLGPGLRALRTSSIAIGKALWGPERGPRAARRAVFELSWRLVGERTYSAAGLPGRLYYHDT